MERKLGILSECLNGVPSVEALKLMKDAGFNCFMTDRYTLDEAKPIIEAGNALGMTCESIHTPFGGINEMWNYGMGYLTVFNGIKIAIDTAAALEVPCVVVHVSSGWNAPQINDLGLSRYDEIVNYAGEKGVKIALENLRKVGNLAYLIDRYEKLPQVGFCYDFGHEHCYTKTVRWMDHFLDKVLTTHIHDNFGRPDDPNGDGDLHLMPFEGNIDYARCMSDINKYGYKGALVLELKNTRYENMTNEEFLATAYERLKKISELG